MRPTPTSRTSAEVLSRRALNRATLERQMLLRRWNTSARTTIEHLAGMQSQQPRAPYVGLWSRLEAFHPEELEELTTTRQVVRIAVMRGTIHLVTADDCLVMRPWVQPLFDRGTLAHQTYGPVLRGVDLDEVAAAGRDLLEQEPRSTRGLGRLLHQTWPGSDPRALAFAVRNRLPLVQVPPRGLWTRSSQPTCTTAQAWLGRPLADAVPADDLVLRYLAAYGPATARDAQAWSGVSRLGEIVERLGPRLRTFRDEAGRELFDTPDAPRPDPDTPAPVRLVAEFDNLILSHADRTRVISDGARRRITTVNGVLPGTVLVDGFVTGTWRINRQRGAATLDITPFARLSGAERGAVEEEGARLLTFAAGDAQTHDVRLHPDDT